MNIQKCFFILTFIMLLMYPLQLAAGEDTALPMPQDQWTEPAAQPENQDQRSGETAGEVLPDAGADTADAGNQTNLDNNAADMVDADSPPPLDEGVDMAEINTQTSPEDDAAEADKQTTPDTAAVVVVDTGRPRRSPNAAVDSDKAVRADTPVPVEEPSQDITDVEEPAAVLDIKPVKQSGVIGFLQRLGIAFLIIIIQAVLIWLIWQRLIKWLNKKIVHYGTYKFKPLMIKNLHVLSVQQIISTIQFLIRIFKYIITAFQLYMTIPLVFSLFPQTENLALTLFNYILNPLKNIIIGIIKYIPNLITIAIILVVTRYAIRALKFFANQIAREKLVIPGFYADWANPTFNILRVLLYAFTVTVIYPYLPGSGSPVFQGVSVFVGIIFSLGSSSAIGNLIAGLVITYMRPFKVGDRIKIQDITGFVVEKSLIVIRIKTHKNEYVTFPNLMILNSNIINYNTSSGEEEEGLILHADVTMGYSVPWTKVHEILIDAALKTKRVQAKPKPFVLQTALDDYYARYQINLYTKDVHRVPAIYSELYGHLQDGFKAAGLDLTSPRYEVLIPPDEPEEKE